MALQPQAAEFAALEYTAPGGRFHRPCTLSELFAVLAREPEAQLFAGATDFGLEISKHFRRFSALVSLEGVRELTELRATPDAWHIGAAVTEVDVDGFTGMTRVLRTDILHDVGAAINTAVCRGQIEGGFVQGMGWLTNEELVWDSEGRLLTHSPGTYKIPTMGDRPRDFRVVFLKDAAQPNTIYGAKAVGEPPLLLAISVREAIRDAVASFRAPGQVRLASPATPEAVLRAIKSG